MDARLQQTHLCVLLLGFSRPLLPEAAVADAGELVAGSGLVGSGFRAGLAPVQHADVTSHSPDENVCQQQERHRCRSLSVAPERTKKII